MALTGTHPRATTFNNKKITKLGRLVIVSYLVNIRFYVWGEDLNILLPLHHLFDKHYLLAEGGDGVSRPLTARHGQNNSRQ